MPADNLQKLESIVKLLSDAVSKKDFHAAVEMLAKYVQDVKKTNETEWTMVHSAFQMLQQKLENAHSSAITDLKGQVDHVFVGKQLDSIKSEHSSAIQTALSNLGAKIDAKLASLRHGKDGKSVDPKKILSQVLSQLPPAPLVPNNLINQHEETIKSLADEIQRLKTTQRTSTPGWGAHPLTVQQSGTTKTKLARFLNFTGATVTHSAQGVTTVAVSGLSALAATETPDGATTVFTFSTATAQPSYILADNTLLRATTQKGTVNWTWSSGSKQATLTIPPQDEILAFI